MRLTLRTLLAYLDDILEPAQAKEIGGKIAESSYATSLVGRINDVVRRRRVSAPEVSGPGSTPDPNIVAEYLDNTLPPESVADLERICLESDAHLAEVAACHQVLTLVKSEPVEIAAGMRERMYALGIPPSPPQTNGTDAAMSHVPRVAGVAAADLPRNPQPGAGEVTLEDRLPAALLSRRRSWARVLPYVVGLVIIGIWGYLMFNDEALNGMLASRSNTTPAPEVELASVDADAAADAVPAESVTESPDAQDDADAVAAIPLEAVAAPKMPISPPAEHGQPIADAQTAPAADSTTTPPETPAVAAATPDVVPQPDAFQLPDAPPEPPAAPDLPPPFALQDASSSGIMLHYRQPDQGWFPLRPRSVIHPQEQIAVPNPFDGVVGVGDAGALAEVVLRGGTHVASLGSTEDGQFGFEIIQGQMIVRRKDSAPADQPVSLRIVARDHNYAIQLLEPGTIVGIEVIPLPPTAVGDDRGAHWCDGGIAVTAGAASVAVDGQPPLNLTPGTAGWLTFVTSADAPAAEPRPLTAPPDWLNLESPSASAIVRRYAALYEDEFMLDQPISQSIRPVVKDRRPPLSELATQTLALTGAYPGLIDALGAAHEEARQAAIIGLQAWLPLEPEHAELLRIELQNRFRPQESEIIERLLWGYSEENARNPVDSEDLIGWMAHDEIAIRELAFFHVLRLTGRRYDYRPNDPAPHRAVAIERWRNYVAEQGALLGNGSPPPAG